MEDVTAAFTTKALTVDLGHKVFQRTVFHDGLNLAGYDLIENDDKVSQLFH